MPLDDLLRDAPGLRVRRRVGDGSVVVTGVTHDSRRVQPGTLFCCVPGSRTDGHQFAPAAVAAGATALLVEHEVDVPVAQVVVDDSRVAMAHAAAAFHGHPSADLMVIGVTGTNGKTTTTHLLGAVLERAGWPTAVLGTLSGVHTTPEAPDLQAELAALRDAGCRAVAMEVSSHALALHRVDAMRFAVAVFTNLGRDHLDFHGNEERYFAAKALLFRPELSAVGVANADDLHGRLLLDASPIPMTPYRLADAHQLVVGARTSTFRWEGHDVRLPFGGRFNVGNALAAATAARLAGIDPAVIADGLSSAPPVPGRFEPVDVGQPFSVVVDYAHTPDGLAEVLRAAREGAGDGRVLVVFGCGGDRDRDKRPVMGRVAAAAADVVVVTSDNPRSEDPAAIMEAVTSGIPPATTASVHREPDRRAAIALAFASARAGDVVVIAGKGHETTQEIRGERRPFDDRVVARELLGGGS